MATKNTQSVIDGETTTLKEFALSCAADLDYVATTGQPISQHPVQADTADTDAKILTALSEMRRIVALDGNALKQEARADYDAKDAAWDDNESLSRAATGRLIYMKTRVEEWSPLPSLEPLRDYMNDQLADAIRLAQPLDEKYAPKLFPPEEWRIRRLEDLMQEVDSLSKTRWAAICRVTERNDFLTQLFNEFNIDPKDLSDD